ncbi:hypothetical protein [Novosphingobium sp. 9]|nr:hypothetical protein [Novosphingobium sp. 9]
MRVVDSLKGTLGPRFSLFTTRDSGGFYLEGNNGSATPDMDHD